MRPLMNLIILCFVSNFCSGQKIRLSAASISNPTGTYKFEGKTKIRDGETFGYFGEIKVKLIDTSRLAMSFYICKGAPSYNSGSFVDTLDYKQNIAVYKDHDHLQSACTVSFTFSKKKIEIKESANYEYGTCWGHGVAAFGSFKKVSNNIPVITDPITSE